jgi:hypothetical protein
MWRIGLPTPNNPHDDKGEEHDEHGEALLGRSTDTHNADRTFQFTSQF